MLSTIIELPGLALPAQVETVQPVEGGFIITGGQVSIQHPFGLTKFYRHGFHSWSLSAWLDLAKPFPSPTLTALWPQLDSSSLLQDYPFSSSGVAALEGTGGKILLLGALALDTTIKADERLLLGKAPTENALWFLTYEEEPAAFAHYTSLLGDKWGRRGQAVPPRVWCSWYSLYRDISEPYLQQVLSTLTGLPFDVFQVDDGWEISLGDWEANQRFPSGLAALADSARQAGFTPGIWLAPLVVQPQSTIFQQHPQWLIKDQAGQLVSAGFNWGDHFYGLDTTHPEVQDWLFRLISGVRQWGYEYLKLDFLYGAALPGERYTGTSPEQAFRQGLDIIRQAAGDAYILACGAPVLASIGLADGMRVGPDVAPFWDNYERSYQLFDPTGPSTLNAIRTTLHRLWLRPLVQVDPDVAFFRTRYNLLKPEEQSLLRSLALITGFQATSDLPIWLDPAELHALKAFFGSPHKIRREGRYLYEVDGQRVNFAPFCQYP